MTDSRTPLVAGNWKMNGAVASVSELRAMMDGLSGDRACDVLVCPPYPLIPAFAGAAQGSAMRIGAQDCHFNTGGAHTGDVSPVLLAEIGCSAVIVGHSERRADHGESDAMVKSKAEAVLANGMTAIICVGETEAERDAGKADAVVLGQIAGSMPSMADASNTVIAYEPVWAIGTGRVPEISDIAAMHAAIRSEVGQGMRILYGGSVKPSNAAEIFALEDVDGGLIGGASLKATDFLGIVNAT